MDFHKAKVKIGEWWIVENVDRPDMNNEAFAGTIFRDYININITRASVHKNQLDFIRYVDLYE